MSCSKQGKNKQNKQNLQLLICERYLMPHFLVPNTTSDGRLNKKKKLVCMD
jgi:hypothetical protein